MLFFWTTNGSMLYIFQNIFSWTFVNSNRQLSLILTSLCDSPQFDPDLKMRAGLSLTPAADHLTPSSFPCFSSHLVCLCLLFLVELFSSEQPPVNCSQCLHLCWWIIAPCSCHLCPRRLSGPLFVCGQLWEMISCRLQTWRDLCFPKCLSFASIF